MPSVSNEPEIDYRERDRQWITLSPFSYEDVNIPQGFECDLASVPRLLWPLVAPFELSVAAPLVHDWLYRHGGVLPDTGVTRARKACDQLFLKIMIEEGVPVWRARAAYHAVRLFGGSSFKES